MDVDQVRADAKRLMSKIGAESPMVVVVARALREYQRSGSSEEALLQIPPASIPRLVELDLLVDRMGEVKLNGLLLGMLPSEVADLSAGA